MSLINWTQATEAVVGMNHPTLADVDNRPLRQVLTASGLDPDADFTGFMSGGGGHIAGNVIIDGNLTVNGNISLTGSFSGNTIVATDITTTTLVVNSTSTLTGAVTGGAYNGQTISSSASFSGTLNTVGDLTVGGRLLFSTAISKIIPGATSISLRNHADSQDNVIVTDAGNVTILGTLGITGGISSLNVIGNFSVNTTQFTVNASTGAVVGGTYNLQTISSSANFTGTLNTVGAFSVTTNKFNVDTSGNTAIAGTLNSAGAFSVATNKFTSDTSGNILIAGTLGVTGLGSFVNLAVSGNITLTTNSTSTIKGTLSTSTVVNLFKLTSGNIARFIAGADASGFDWTRQTEVDEWMKLTQGLLTVWTNGSASTGGGIKITTDPGSNPSIINADPYNHQFGQGSLNLLPVAIVGGNGAGAFVALSYWSGVTATPAVKVANVNSGTSTLNLMSGGGTTVLGGGLTIASGATLTLTGTTITGTPTWSSNQAITLSTAAQGNVTSLGTLTSVTTSGALTFTSAVSKIIPGATSISLRNNADSADNLIILDNGNATILGTLGIIGNTLNLGTTGVTYTIQGTATSGTNIVAGAINIIANLSTGSGTPGSIIFQGGQILGTGSTVQTAATIATLRMGATTGISEFVFGQATARIISGSTNGIAIRNSANTRDNLAMNDAGTQLSLLSTSSQATITISRLAQGDLAAGYAVFESSIGGAWIGGTTLNSAAGIVGGLQYYNQTNHLSAAEVSNVAAGFGTLSLMKSGGTVTIGTTKFTVAAATGNTLIAGNLTFSTAITQVIPGATSYSIRNNANSVDNFIITDGGDATLSGNFIMSSGKYLQLGNAYAVGAILATGSVDIKDSTGTVYHVLVHT